MSQPEFDSVAHDYDRMHRDSIRMSGEDPAYFARYKIEALAGMLPPGSKPEILDFGAGTGNSIPHFRELLPDAPLTCADVSGESLALAEQDNPGAARFVQITDERLPAEDASFDVAFTACVFHHIEPEEHLHWLSEIKRVVRPGGIFVLVEHNPWNPLTLRAVNNCPFDENAILITAPEMRRRFRRAGWDEVRTRFIVFFPAALSALRPLERGLGWCGLGAQYMCVATRSQ